MVTIKQMENEFMFNFNARNIRRELREYGIGKGPVFKRGAAAVALNYVRDLAIANSGRWFYSLGHLTDDEFYIVMNIVRPYKRREY